MLQTFITLYRLEKNQGEEQEVYIGKYTNILKVFAIIEEICKPSFIELGYKQRMDLIKVNRTFDMPDNKNFLIKILKTDI